MENEKEVKSTGPYRSRATAQRFSSTTEYIGQRFTVAKFRKTLAILLPSQELVKSVLQPA